MPRARTKLPRVQIEEPAEQLDFTQTPGLRTLPQNLDKIPEHFAKYARTVWAQNFDGEIRPDDALQDEFENFCIYHWKRGDKCRNWYAAWMSWARISVRFEKEKRRTQQASSRPSVPHF